MATQPAPAPGGIARFIGSLRTQGNVIGALLMRELHTRYGRENVGYLWMIGEPLTLAGAIAILHSGHTTEYGGGMNPLPFAVLGYCVFIMFRGIFNRAEGALESNMALLYHKMVTVLDIMLARALLEGAGTFLCLVIIMALLTSLGLAEPPARPLYLMLAIGLMWWFSFACSLSIVAITHDNRLIARFVHPLTYILMPLSGSFYQIEWIPEPYRTYLTWFPLTGIFETARYGYFLSGDLDYANIDYVAGSCMVLTLIGLIAVKLVRKHVHLN